MKQVYLDLLPKKRRPAAAPMLARETA